MSSDDDPKRKRKINSLSEDLVEIAQPLLDELLDEDDAVFSIDNVIEAVDTEAFDDLEITIDNGDEIIEQLDALRRWMKWNKGGESKKRKTRSGTAPYRDTLTAIKDKITSAESTIIRLREQQALRNRAPAPQGNRGDGNFYIASVKMGQGDCTLISTPGGRVIMIDCGSDATESEPTIDYEARIKGVLQDKKFMKGRNIIDILILTHADTDHYNKLPTMLGDSVIIRDIYHSASLGDYSSQGNVGKAISSWLGEHVSRDDSIKAVTHNVDDGIEVNGIANPEEDDDLGYYVDDANGLRILDEDNCTITILASNMHTIYKDKYKNPLNDSSNNKNRGSIVTLIEVFGEKILICGDATINTEQYLIRTHRNRIKNLTIVQAPHHGSVNTSSSRDFVAVVNSQTVLISAGKKIAKDHLPSALTIIRYEAQIKRSAFDEIDEHRVFYWTGNSSGGYSEDDRFIKHPIFITGSWGTVEKKIIDLS